MKLSLIEVECESFQQLKKTNKHWNWAENWAVQQQASKNGAIKT